ncbi:hypothetical protein QBC46DRAFT_441628 [Diplogelasinospora grovesii]|uniref:Uncharacterized protein n=1 Tax=Diplogelasinospora grovesii TaxID=303347 RepID=A0AAN6N495_9PEZI|nr:hypothetical protein QBC46DRAFT_441628 [Diplogelasinospora grovesii]
MASLDGLTVGGGIPEAPPTPYGWDGIIMRGCRHDGYVGQRPGPLTDGRAEHLRGSAELMSRYGHYIRNAVGIFGFFMPVTTVILAFAAVLLNRPIDSIEHCRRIRSNTTDSRPMLGPRRFQRTHLPLNTIGTFPTKPGHGPHIHHYPLSTTKMRRAGVLNDAIDSRHFEKQNDSTCQSKEGICVGNEKSKKQIFGELGALQDNKGSKPPDNFEARPRRRHTVSCMKALHCSGRQRKKSTLSTSSTTSSKPTTPNSDTTTITTTFGYTVYNKFTTSFHAQFTSLGFEDGVLMCLGVVLASQVSTKFPFDDSGVLPEFVIDRQALSSQCRLSVQNIIPSENNWELARTFYKG